jgi:hypothetical protein
MAIVILLGTSACAPRRPAGPATGETSRVVFVNESPDQAELWVLSPGVNVRRIGTVMTGETATFRIPQEFASTGNVSFIARIRHRASTLSTGSVPVRPGDELRLRLPRDEKLLSILH